MGKLRIIIINRIKRLRTDIEKNKNDNIFDKCIRYEGAVLALESVLMDLNVIQYKNTIYNNEY